jgi:hypothetical protein
LDSVGTPPAAIPLRPRKWGREAVPLDIPWNIGSGPLEKAGRGAAFIGILSRLPF